MYRATMHRASRYLLASLFVLLANGQQPSTGPQFTSDNQLVRPKDYREWIFLTSGLGMTYGPAAEAAHGEPNFDNVFVNPSSYRAFLQTGKWPDQTMFILEIRKAVAHESINNAGHTQTGIVAVEAAVKDETRFPEKWAYFGFPEAGGPAKALPSSARCFTCHSKNAAVDNTFVQFYPTLLPVAKDKGTVSANFTGADAKK